MDSQSLFSFRQQPLMEYRQSSSRLHWEGDQKLIAFTPHEISHMLQAAEKPVYFILRDNRVGVASEGTIEIGDGGDRLIAFAPALTMDMLGNPYFCSAYRTKYAFYCGAMANGISSENMIIALGQQGILGSFGAGGLSLDKIEAAIMAIKSEIPDKPYMFNLLNSPNEPTMEQRTIELYLKHHIQTIEASAYLIPTINLVYYRATGLSQGVDGKIVLGNRIIAKLSRKEIAKKFMSPPSPDSLRALLETGRITQRQADLAQYIPLADDITVEADSGGHTDNRPLVCSLPAVIRLRDQLQEKYHYDQAVRVGAAGGIATPEAAAAAFTLGAAYIVTGSVNQACIESGTSDHTRELLANTDMADVAMAPSGDMFEMGVKVQVLKRGTMFAMRAQKLYELYTRYPSLDDIPRDEIEKLEKQIFRGDIGSIWQDCLSFFRKRDPKQIERAESNPKDKMALVFRWYLGLSSRWSISGEKGREMDYQIWCGPAMGAFNDWVRGSYLEDPSTRRVADISRHLMSGCAYILRLRIIEAQGIVIPPEVQRHVPIPQSV